MTTFDKREQGFESKFAHDEETRFKITSRRNKLAGLWAAEKLGHTGEDADAYAKSVVMADFEKPGDEDVVEKLFRDLSAAGQETGRDVIRAELARLLPVAGDQIQNG